MRPGPRSHWATCHDSRRVTPCPTPVSMTARCWHGAWSPMSWRRPHVGKAGKTYGQALKHFAPGAKVWVLPPHWGDGGEKVMVIGRHRGRGQGRLARMVVGRHHLAGFRVRGVYSPAVHRELVRPWKPWGDHPLKLWDSRDEAEQAALWWNGDHATRSGVRQPRQRGDLVDTLAMLVAPEPWQPLPYGIGRMVSGFLIDPPDPANTVSALLRDRHAWSEVVPIRSR